MATRWQFFLQDRFDALLIAVGAKVMCRFFMTELWFQAAYQCAWYQLAKLVTFLFLLPAFELSIFVFKFSNAKQYCLVFRLRCKQLLLNTQNMAFISITLEESSTELFNASMLCTASPAAFNPLAAATISGQVNIFYSK